MRNVSAETLMNCERKICFAYAQESKQDLKCESNSPPLQLQAFK